MVGDGASGMPSAAGDGPVAPGVGPGARKVGPGVVALTGLAALPDDEDGARAVVSALVRDAFAAGSHRVEAEIDPHDLHVRRVLQRAGLRPEGTGRGRGLAGGIPQDLLRLARLRDDPAPGEPGAFLAMLNATLPRKRVIVQGIVRDGQGRILLCELTYKRDWDLPGGVAEPAESPVVSLERELVEELGLELGVGDLVAVDWLPPYKQWEDAVLLVFDVGTHPDLHERATLQPSEIRGVHWVAPQDAPGHVAPYVARLLSSLVDLPPGRCLFLEDGLPRGA